MRRSALYSLFCIAAAVSMSECAAAPTVLRFEDVAPSGGYFDLSNGFYVESGFSVHPGLQIVDSQASLKMAGNNSDWFAFKSTGARYDVGIAKRSQLFSVLELTFGPAIDPVTGLPTPSTFNYTAHTRTGTTGGGTGFITTATVFKLNLHQIDFLEISSSNHASIPAIVGIDNIVLTPEGDSQTLLIYGLALGLTATRRRRMAQFFYRRRGV